jgi:hypothetical protein
MEPVVLTMAERSVTRLPLSILVAAVLNMDGVVTLLCTVGRAVSLDALLLLLLPLHLRPQPLPLPVQMVGAELGFQVLLVQDHLLEGAVVNTDIVVLPMPIVYPPMDVSLVVQELKPLFLPLLPPLQLHLLEPMADVGPRLEVLLAPGQLLERVVVNTDIVVLPISIVWHPTDVNLAALEQPSLLHQLLLPASR